MKRQAAVAGQFYPGNRDQLAREMGGLIAAAAGKKRAFGIIAPHAGYVYSGAIAGKVYGAIEIPQAVLVLGPNHHGRGAAAALYPPGEWQTPLGPVPINERLNDCITSRTPYLQSDHTAHAFEHSLEVQLPFLQTLRSDVTPPSNVWRISVRSIAEMLGNSRATCCWRRADSVVVPVRTAAMNVFGAGSSTPVGKTTKKLGCIRCHSTWRKLATYVTIGTP